MDTLSFADQCANCPWDRLGGNPPATTPLKKGNVVASADPIKESGVLPRHEFLSVSVYSVLLCSSVLALVTAVSLGLIEMAAVTLTTQ